MHLISQDAVFGAAGVDPRIYRTPLVTYVLGSDVLTIVFEPGDRPGHTGIQDARHAAVAAPFPDEIYALLYPWPAVSSREGAVFRVEGYARLGGGCVPLGSLRECGASWDPCSEGLLSCTFELDPALPFGLLDRIRSAIAPQPERDMPKLDWLRLLPHDPVGATSAFVTDWYADVGPVCGPHPPAAVPMPPALAALHAAIAYRRDLLGRQDSLFAPHELRLDDAGRLLFGAENQGCFVMATELAGDDPPVWFLREDEEPELKPLPLSQFLLATVLYEATQIGHYTMYGAVWREDKDRILTGLHRAPLPNREWLDWQSDTYVGRGLIVQLTPNGDTGQTWSVSAGARRRDDLRAVEKFRNH
ncbi:hypothetical protein ACQEVZ_07780 [Dactylosporangium sp. CA-152071]|uniref:hypothetical protein n=1 Tax=Dactylosporangium sp. CA-152071 TaxID=3239933 RepID=UPI003D8D90A5